VRGRHRGVEKPGANSRVTRHAAETIACLHHQHGLARASGQIDPRRSRPVCARPPTNDGVPVAVSAPIPEALMAEDPRARRASRGAWQVRLAPGAPMTSGRPPGWVLEPHRYRTAQAACGIFARIRGWAELNSNWSKGQARPEKNVVPSVRAGPRSRCRCGVLISACRISLL